jgi:hypothetical protein
VHAKVGEKCRFRHRTDQHARKRPHSGHPAAPAATYPLPVRHGPPLPPAIQLQYRNQLRRRLHRLLRAAKTNASMPSSAKPLLTLKISSTTKDWPPLLPAIQLPNSWCSHEHEAHAAASLALAAPQMHTAATVNMHRVVMSSPLKPSPVCTAVTSGAGLVGIGGHRKLATGTVRAAAVRRCSSSQCAATDLRSVGGVPLGVPNSSDNTSLQQARRRPAMRSNVYALIGSLACAAQAQTVGSLCDAALAAVNAAGTNDLVCSTLATADADPFSCWASECNVDASGPLTSRRQATTCSAYTAAYADVCATLTNCVGSVQNTCSVMRCNMQSQVDSGALQDTVCATLASQTDTTPFSTCNVPTSQLTALTNAATCASLIAAYSDMCPNLGSCGPNLLLNSPSPPSAPPPVPLAPPSPPTPPPSYPPIPPSSFTPNRLRYDEAPQAVVMSTFSCTDLVTPPDSLWGLPLGLPAGALLVRDNEADYLGKMMDVCWNNMLCAGIELASPGCTSHSCCRAVTAAAGASLCQANPPFADRPLQAIGGLSACVFDAYRSAPSYTVYVASESNPPRTAPSPPSPPSPPPPMPPPPSVRGDSGCDGGCIGGIIGGCFVPVLICILWLGGAFAKFGCPSPCAKKEPKDAGVTMTNINSANAAA